MIRHYMQMSMKDKKKIRDAQEELAGKTKKMIEHYENLFIRPLKNRLKLFEQLRKGQISVEQFKYSLEKINNYIEETRKLFKV